MKKVFSGHFTLIYIDGIYKPIKDNCSEVLQLKLQPDQYLISFYRLDNGEKLLTPEKLQSEMLAANQRAEVANQRAEAANQQLAQEKARADRLAAKLQELGITLDN